MTDLVTLHIDSFIATITLNHPQTLNAMDEAMGKEFSTVVKKIAQDASVRVVVITGAGRAFSSGGNLDMLEARIKKNQETNKAELKAFYQIYLELRNLPQPTVAAINGPAVGAGFCLALACDLRYASIDAKMGANFARIGLAPGMGGTYLITRLLGPLAAAEVLMLANLYSAMEAKELGLVSQVFAADQLLAETNRVAQRIAANAPLSVQMIKKGIHLAMQATLEEMFDYDSACQASSFATADIKEGVRALREKRNPQFMGK